MLFHPNPPLVWHYTSAQGLLGILSTDAAEKQAERTKQHGIPSRGAFSLRLTDALYLNDPLELRYGRKMLADCIEAQLTDLTGDDAEEVGEVVEWLRTPAESGNGEANRITGGTYVACFSRQKDSLSQWRGYAPGRGYAIGFDENMLQYLVAPIAADDPGMVADWEIELVLRPRVYPVVYGDKAAQEWFTARAADIINPAALFSSPIPRRYLAELALALAKQDAYNVEEEVRAVIVQGPTPLVREFREGALGVVPYVTAGFIFPFGPKGGPPLIREIQVGPGDDGELRREAVVQRLETLGFGPQTINVSTSAFQFRG